MKSVVLVSGGIDSTTVLHKAVRDYQEDVTALSIIYGQKHSKEIECAKWQCEDLGVPLHVLDLSILKNYFSSSSLVGSEEIPHIKDVLGDPQPSTYVPNRNMILLSIAVGFAENIEASRVYYGAQKHDLYGYWDTTPEFLSRVNQVLDLNRKNTIQIYAPLVNLKKSEVIALGLEMNIDYSHTWSCLAKGTKVRTLCGDKEIETLRIGEWVWGWNEGWVPSQILNFFEQGRKEVYRIVLDDKIGQLTEFYVTGDHLLMLRNGDYARVDEISKGISLMPATLHKMESRLKKREDGLDNHYVCIHPTNDWKEPAKYAHRMVAEFFGIEGEIIHHIDNNPWNNNPENLMGMSRGEHSYYHGKLRTESEEANSRRRNTVKRQWSDMTPEEYLSRCNSISEGRRKSPLGHGNKRKDELYNHRVVSIDKHGEDLTYDIETTTGNFAIQAGIFVHNCYAGTDKPDPTCATCAERIKAFKELGLVDPLEYMR